MTTTGAIGPLLGTGNSKTPLPLAPALAKPAATASHGDELRAFVTSTAIQDASDAEKAPPSGTERESKRPLKASPPSTPPPKRLGGASNARVSRHGRRGIGEGGPVRARATPTRSCRPSSGPPGTVFASRRTKLSSSGPRAGLTTPCRTPDPALLGFRAHIDTESKE